MGRLSWITQGTLIIITCVLMGGRQRLISHREGIGTMEAEIVVVWPQAKEYWQPPKEEEATECALEPLEGAWSCWHLGFSLLAPRTVKE